MSKVKRNKPRSKKVQKAKSTSGWRKLIGGRQKISLKSLVLSVLAIILAFYAFATIVIIVWSILGNKSGSYIDAKNKAEQYLEKKYGEKFSVKGLNYSGGGVGVEGSWSTEDAHPISDSSLKFRVGCSSRGCSDTYLDSYFSKKEQDRLKPFMDSIGVKYYSIRLIIGYEPLDQITKSTSLADVIQTDPIYEISIVAENAEDENALVDKIMTVINDAYNNKVSRVELDYKVTTKEGKMYSCTTNYEDTPKLTNENVKSCIKEK